ncbi:hypothetical protein OF122_12255 [Pelagibacterium flavum]|uniref:Uncharacterized protein n=1 Tax=Pelagibacterium flavum TaxID=2984530 RepID=A0ABY6IM78_9HYPH|nr:hypothetical protein [Pelagibacterium sp. YIM 151497]UYQ70835.1 hypothetical protein OF122_12255 [Pelagibacterium sp. YIM 151497]
MGDEFREDPHFWQKRAFDRQDIRFESQINAAIESGHHAVKAALLLNGAACIALLGFLASTISSIDGEPATAQLIALFMNALMEFSKGALAAAVTAGLGYLTNLCAGESAASMSKHFVEPFIRSTRASKIWGGAYFTLSLVTIATAIGSYVFFARGLARISGWF